MKKLKNLKTSVRLSIENPKSDASSVFGPGIAALCEGVRELGSLNAAAKSMKMAYSKAWRIIKDTETALGFQLLDRDGAHGSQLTPEGEALLSMYTTISEKLGEESTKLFQKLNK